MAVGQSVERAPVPIESITTRSPNGSLALTVPVRATDRGPATPVYAVTYRGAALVGESALGLDFAEPGPFGGDVRIARVTRAAHDETVRGLVGKASTARDHYRETVIELVVRAYDDGVAFRYRIPAQPALAAFAIRAEESHVVVDGASQAYVLKRDGFTSSYEGFYTVAPLRALPADTLLALPVLLHHPGGAWLAITEAALADYAGMYLARTGAAAGDLASRLSPLPNDSPRVAVRGRAPRRGAC